MRFLLCLIYSLAASNLVAAKKDLDIVGTGCGQTLLTSVVQTFNQKNPDLKINVPKSIGSGGGIAAVGNERAILGRISRPISEKEKIFNLQKQPYALLPIVFFVNDSVNLTNISSEQVCDIYSGKIRNWEQLGAGKGKIRVIQREEDDSSRLALLKDLPCYTAIKQTKRVKVITNDAKTLIEAQRVKNSIAYGSIDNIKGQPGIHALALNNLNYTKQNYPIKTQLSIIYKQTNQTQKSQVFLQFLQQGDARQVIRNAGGRAVN